MGEVEGMDQRLAHIGIGLAGQRRQPRFDRVDALALRREAEAIDDPLDAALNGI